MNGETHKFCHQLVLLLHLVLRRTLIVPSEHLIEPLREDGDLRVGQHDRLRGLRKYVVLEGLGRKPDSVTVELFNQSGANFVSVFSTKMVGLPGS